MNRRANNAAVSSPPASSSARIWLRGVAFVLIGAWLIIGPLVRGPLNQEQIKWVSRWEMFGLFGRGICDVRYVQHHADGTKSRVDWIEMLGRSRDWDKRRRNRIRDNKEAFRTGRRLCRELDGDPVDLRMRVLCGSSTTWKRKEWGKTNICSKEGAEKAREQK